MKTNFTTIKLLVCLLLGCISSVTNTQITIGTAEAPASGALLDLKTIKGVTNGAANSTKGLVLPRVALESNDDLYPMFSDSKTDYLANKEDIDKAHTGLIVYNLNDLNITITYPSTECEPARVTNDGGVQPGIVVWTGEKWVNIGEKSLPPEEIILNDRVTIIKDVEGNYYTTASFGAAGTWMTQNMRSRTFDTES